MIQILLLLTLNSASWGETLDSRGQLPLPSTLGLSLQTGVGGSTGAAEVQKNLLGNFGGSVDLRLIHGVFLGGFYTGQIGFGTRTWSLVTSNIAGGQLSLTVWEHNSVNINVGARGGFAWGDGFGPFFFPVATGWLEAPLVGPKFSVESLLSSWVGLGVQIAGYYVFPSTYTSRALGVQEASQNLPGFWLGDVSLLMTLKIL